MKSELGEVGNIEVYRSKIKEAENGNPVTLVCRESDYTNVLNAVVLEIFKIESKDNIDCLGLDMAEEHIKRLQSRNLLNIQLVC